MKKFLYTSSLIALPFGSILATVSCASTPKDYMVMAFKIDDSKLKKVVANPASIEAFNRKSISVEKLYEITKTTPPEISDPSQLFSQYERYTLNALGYYQDPSSKKWIQDLTKKSFEIIEIQQIGTTNTKYQLLIKLKQDSPYRLPNSQTELKHSFAPTPKINYERN